MQVIRTACLSYCTKARYHCATIRHALGCELSSFHPHYVRLQLWELCKKNVWFVLFTCIIFLFKMLSYRKMMMLNKFIHDFFFVSRTVLEIKTLTQNFSARWNCRQFHCVAHDNFTRPTQHFYDYSFFHLEIIWVVTDFSRDTI